MSTQSLYLVMLVSVKPGFEEEFSIFSKKNMPLLAEYGITPFKTLGITVKGQLAGLNDIPQPDLISLFKIPSMERFMEYMGDERYKELSEMRAACTNQVIGYFTNEVPLPTPFKSASNPSERMYVVGLANFKESNSAGIDQFNLQAVNQGLFAKHGMHVELQLKPFKVATVVGTFEAVMPDRIQLFFVDKPENLKNYITDPLYKELSPIRDNSLVKYDFFGGVVK